MGNFLRMTNGVPRSAAESGGGSSNLPANVVTSPSSGAFQTTSTSYVDVTNLSCTITTHGGPVMMVLVPDGNTISGQESNMFFNGSTNTSEMKFQFLRGSTPIAIMQRETSNSGLTDIYESTPVGSVNAYDTPAAGTYTYKLQIKRGSGASAGVAINYSKLLVFELSGGSTSGATSFIGSAKILGSGSGGWSKTGISLGAFSPQSVLGGPVVLLNPGVGTIQTTDTDLPRFTVNGLAAGTYKVQIDFFGYGSGSGQVYSYAINDGTTTGTPRQFIAPAANRGSLITLVEYFTYTVGGNVSFEVFGATGSGTVGIENDGTGNGGGDMFFSIERVDLSGGTTSTPSTTKTANYSLADADSIIYADTTSPWTLTVQAASATNKDKIFRIKKTTSDFNVLTLSGGLSTTLNTIGEQIEIINDGTTWSILSRTGISGVLVSTSVVTILGSSSNPGRGTITVDTASWYRHGSELECIYSSRQQGAGSNGSGSYMLSAIPTGSGLSIDTSKITPGDENGDIMIGICGSAYLRYSSNWFHAQAMYNTSNGVSGVAIVWDGAVGWTSASGGLGSNANVDASASWKLPITGWNS